MCLFDGVKHSWVDHCVWFGLVVWSPLPIASCVFCHRQKSVRRGPTPSYIFPPCHETRVTINLTMLQENIRTARKIECFASLLSARFGAKLHRISAWAATLRFWMVGEKITLARQLSSSIYCLSWGIRLDVMWSVTSWGFPIRHSRMSRCGTFSPHHLTLKLLWNQFRQELEIRKWLGGLLTFSPFTWIKNKAQVGKLGDSFPGHIGFLRSFGTEQLELPTFFHYDVFSKRWQC